MLTITQSQARRLAVASCFATDSQGKDHSTTLKTIEHLGYVQIDTISVIERAHLHILWSRQPGFSSDHLNHLLSHERSVFEHWAHAVAYLPIRDYRYFRPKMEAYRSPSKAKWQQERFATAKPLFKQVLKRIEGEGPLGSKDFEHKRKRQGEGWWDWKPAKVALEYLYLQGDLMVAGRKRFQRQYDLTERVLQPGLDLSMPSPEDCALHQIEMAIQSMGIVREADINRYLQVSDRKTIRAVLRDSVSRGSVLELKVRGSEGDLFYMTGEVLRLLEKSRSTKPRVRILSPFYNLVIQRDWMRALFNFDYTIECYVPAPKRKYGYFVCPMLWGDELVARVDMKADRKARQLKVLALHYEPGLKKKAPFDAALKQELQRFALFNGCQL